MLDEEGRSLPNESRLLLNVRDEPPALGDGGKPNVGSARVGKTRKVGVLVLCRSFVYLCQREGAGRRDSRSLSNRSSSPSSSKSGKTTLPRLTSPVPAAVPPSSSALASHPLTPSPLNGLPFPTLPAVVEEEVEREPSRACRARNLSSPDAIPAEDSP